jgi:F420-non-reducing hydrogenase iron-sulfur subunit
MTATVSAERLTVALFYCHNTPGSTERDRRCLEERFGESLRLYPLPCSGRLEPLHLLQSLEEFADAAFLITCPKGECRYFEGNLRAEKRVQHIRNIIKSIGLKGERVGFLMNSKEDPKPLAALTEDIMEAISRLEPSPVLNSQPPMPCAKEKREIPHDYR